MLAILLTSLLLRPTFASCSVETDPAIQNPVVEYRAGSGKWVKVEKFHGSLVNLDEDTTYEVRVFDGESVACTGTFRTWKTDVPVAKTIVLDPDTLKTPYLVNGKGSADGWIRYTVKGGTFHNPKDCPTFEVRGAEYVILDDMTLTGAAESRYVITINDSKGVRIRNCDISGWGRFGRPDFSYDFGKTTPDGRGRVLDENRKGINWDAAIFISRGTSECVVERCYIHDAIIHTCSWYYCHPSGSEAVFMDCPDHSTVLRYNDFVGSDTHRFNDCVEGNRNFYPDGGFNQDADIYGNFMAFSNDDAIELDGGQKNVRLYGNRFEANFCGVSIQGCMVGPSILWDNMFSGMCDEFGKTGQTIKTDRRNGPDAHTYIYNNFFWGGGSGISMRETLAAEVTGNTFCGNQNIKNLGESPKSSASDNRMGVEIAEEKLDCTFPRRDLPFTLERARVNVGKARTQLRIKIKGTVPKGTKVVRPYTSDWFDGKLVKGYLEVTFNPEKMQKRRNYRGALLLRTPDGLSRTLTLYADTDFVPPYKCEQAGETAIYDDNFNINGKETATATFNVEKAGRYYFMIHGHAGEGNSIRTVKIKVSVDGTETLVSRQSMYGYDTWSILIPRAKKYESTMIYTQHYDLEPGVHTVTVTGSETSRFHGMVLTDSPESFEPNREYDYTIK